jgi:hypothetical protein
MYTGTLYGKYAGWIRFLCNGFLDIIYKEKDFYIRDLESKKEIMPPDGCC